MYSHTYVIFIVREKKRRPFLLSQHTLNQSANVRYRKEKTRQKQQNARDDIKRNILLVIICNTFKIAPRAAKQRMYTILYRCSFLPVIHVDRLFIYEDVGVSEEVTQFSTQCWFNVHLTSMTFKKHWIDTS